VIVIKTSQRLMKLRLCFNFCVTVGETSVLPNVYRNSFPAGIMETTNEFRYSENNRYQSTIRRRSCPSCSSGQTTAWNNVTSLPTYRNFTVSNRMTTTVRRRRPRPPYDYRRSVWFLLHKIRNIIQYIVATLSLVTNFLSIALFLYMRRTRKLKNELFLVFVSISVVDTFALSMTFNTVTSLMLGRKMTVLYYNIGCQVLQWLAASSQVCSSWLVFLYTFERFIYVRFPLKHAIICSGRRICTAVLCILVFGPISQMYSLVLYEHRGSSCFVNYRSIKKSYLAI